MSKVKRMSKVKKIKVMEFEVEDILAEEPKEDADDKRYLIKWMGIDM